MNDDTISRQAAIDELDVLCQEHRYKIPGKFETYSQYNEAWQDALDRAEGAIGNLPPAQQWIPCSERLPEKAGIYLVTNTKWGYPEREICDWLPGIKQWGTRGEPIAWMPLPEPYKEGEA